MSVAIEGHVAPGLEAVRDAFAKNFTDNGEVGASFAVARDGQLIVDLWGGHADAARTRPWRADTITTVYSTSKGMTALVLAMLADRGLLDYEERVAHYWPEFAAEGKDAVTVAQLLSHQAGLCGWRERLGIEEIYDWEKSTASLAAQAPLWPPGTNNGYHAMTFGHLAGEVARRITGVSLGQWLAAEVARPLGADFFIGLPSSEEGRVAEMIAAEPASPPADAPAPSEAQKLAFGVVLGDAHNTRAWRAAEIPAANGQGNARALATIYAELAAGGGRLLSEDALRAATQLECERQDAVLGFPMRWSRGFILNRLFGEYGIYGPNERAFGHSGAGGSFGYADPDAGIGVGYVMNQMHSNLQGDPRGLALLGALYGALG